MKKVFLGLFLVMIVLGIEVPAMGQSGSAPVYKDDDQWVYRLTRHSGGGTNLLEGDYKIIYQNGEHESDHTLFLESVATVNIQGNEIKWLDFPLKSGKKWKFSYTTEDRRGRTVRLEANVEVVGSKPVDTQAGKFTDAIEIRRKDTGGRRDKEYIFFYSPVVKGVVKILLNRSNRDGELEKRWEVELIKYTVK